MEGKGVQRGVVAGFVVGVATGGVLLVAARRALKGVALASTAVVGGTVAGALAGGGVYVVSRRPFASESTEPANTGSSSQSASADRLSQSHFSLPGEHLLIPSGSIQEQLRGARLRFLAAPSLHDQRSNRRTYGSDELSFLGGPTGILMVLKPPRDQHDWASLLQLSQDSRWVDPPAPVAKGKGDGGLIPVNRSRRCELACCDGESVVIYNFQTGDRQRFHLPADLTSDSGRAIYRSPSGEYWVCARRRGSTNHFHYARLSRTRSVLRSAEFRTGYFAVTNGRFTFPSNRFFGAEQGSQALLIGNQADGRAVYFQEALEEGVVDGYRCRQPSTIVAGLSIRGCSEGLVVESLTGRSQIIPMDGVVFRAVLVETTRGALAVTWTGDGQIKVIDTTKSLDEAVEDLETELDLDGFDCIEALYDGRILAFRRDKECHLVDSESGEVLTTLELPAETCELFDTAWGVFAACGEGYGVTGFRLEPVEGN